MSEDTIQTELERQEAILAEAEGKDAKTKVKAYTKLSGPGWLQSAITLGGGSLTGALYLGVLGGYQLLWVQAVAMICGVIMLSAISYVTLSTGERPFRSINTHINPVLGWSWIIAVLMANIVWCLPQFGLGTAAVQQNLLPGLFGADGPIGDTGSKIIICLLLLGAASTVIWFYDSGSKGIRLFEVVLKVMVGLIVVSFVGVVLVMTFSGDGLPWGEIISGVLVPKFSLLFEPAERLAAMAAETSNPDYWTAILVNEQRNVIITAAATAVGINMTFLLPYSMLRKRWNHRFRGLAIFDLGTALFIPYIIATTCVVVASASQFHGKIEPGLISGEGDPPANVVGAYQKNLATFVAKGGVAEDAVTEADKEMAAVLVRRDAFNLAQALKPLTGATVSHYVFGFGVLAMALSTIIILMLISGFTFCEMANRPGSVHLHRAGCLVAGIVGAAGPFVWAADKARFWLAVPTSTFGMMLLPIAYLTFVFMMNSKKLLGEHLPQGASRLRWNVAMGIALAASIFGAAWSIIGKKQVLWTIGETVIEARDVAVGLYVLIAVLAVVFHFKKPKQAGGAG